ncbi:MAG: RIP metalloprotease RseP [Rhodothermia bacterium]|nr:MAG: RIP metalloprotease RseP [Rhodothermia bacterium]
MGLFSDILATIGWLLLAIMILVFAHELGHFLFAKLFKMRVEKFSIGFPPKVIGKKFGDTEYVIGLTPLGGYVKISGMVDESMDTDELSSEPQPWEFRSKPVWQRIIVITAGVVFNMILAAVVFISLSAFYGFQIPVAEGLVKIQEGSIAYDMGLRTGDRVTAVNGSANDANKRLTRLQEILKADQFVVEFEREGATQTVHGPDDIMTRLNRSGGTFGVGFDAAIIGEIIEGGGAKAAGLHIGDLIERIDGKPVSFYSTMSELVQESEGESMVVRFRRPDSLSGIIPPGAVAIDDPSGAGVLYETSVAPTKDGGRYLLGVRNYLATQKHTPIEAIGAGLSDTWTSTSVIITSLGRMFSGRENIRENIGGPIMIAKVTKEAADLGAFYFWKIVAMLSITLAIINILPIPALDGGHLVFLVYEGIVRREPSLKLRMVLQQIGMVLLLAFMAFAIFNDILKL